MLLQSSRGTYIHADREGNPLLPRTSIEQYTPFAQSGALRGPLHSRPKRHPESSNDDGILGIPSLLAWPSLVEAQCC